MAAVEQRIFSPEDTIRLLTEKAQKDQDTFVLKVFRKMHLAQAPTIIAVFEDAQVQHFTSPELWLPSLAGGGKYQILGYHHTDLNKSIGSYISLPIEADPRDVDLAVSTRPDWRGPMKLAFPVKEAPRGQPDMPLYDVRSPPGPGSSDSATRSAWARSPGGGVHRQGYEEGGDVAFGVRAGALEAERRKLEAEKLDAERERHKADVAAREAAHKAELASMRSELMQEVRSLRSEKKDGPDPMVEFMKMQAEERRSAEAARREDARLERERQDRMDARAAEDRKAERDRQDRIEQRIADERRADRERTEKMFEKLNSDKKDPLEILEKAASLLAKKGDGSDAMLKSMNNVLEVQSTVMGATMDFVERAAGINLGGGSDEPAWVKGVDRVMRGIGKFVQAGARPGPVFPPQPQIPGGQAQPPQPQPQGQPRPPQAETQAPIIDQLIGGILAHHDPVMVAKALVAYYKDPSVQAAIAEAGNDPEKALLQRLGNWPNAAPQNVEYLKRLMVELEKQIQAAGFFQDPKEESGKDDGDEGDDEGEDEDDDEEGSDEPEEGDENDE